MTQPLDLAALLSLDEMICSLRDERLLMQGGGFSKLLEVAHQAADLLERQPALQARITDLEAHLRRANHELEVLKKLHFDPVRGPQDQGGDHG